MENERENSIDGLIRRFLLKGEEVDMKALREELKGEDRDAVKRRLLRLRKMGLQPDRMKIWREVQDELARRSTRQRVLRYVRYAAVFLLPLLLACILLMRQEECSCFGGGGWQAGHDDCPEGVFVTGRGKTDRVVHFGERFDSWEGWEVVGH